MEYIEKQWNFIIDEFKRRNPLHADQIRTWYPIARFKVLIELEGGEIFLYNGRINENGDYCRITFNKHTEDYRIYISEYDWAFIFSELFDEKLRTTDWNQEWLHYQCGISRTSLNKYVHGKATPSLYNMTKITRALKCGLDEFYIPDIDVSEMFVRSVENWDAIVDEFGYLYFKLSEEVMDWYPVGEEYISIRLNNDTRYLYGVDKRELIKTYDPYDTYTILPEEDWRIEFSKILCREMMRSEISKTDLSYMTRISLTMINRYTNGAATPSLYNATKIARALGCTLGTFQI
ncbi:MAG: helix-turn-helix transcriptional regulator [Ruminococcus sp.]|nr:helix-turn-helix transcriptional regulator [Ruminococcus sp.]MBO5319114.1 helix-turn-helix transcriptional regulator [Ruminococcus sp.]